ncbi:leucine-rich repeat neuronal protein 4 [Cheilinus undulatus]|uniref:leucine-rich repeat neuronal protein 4 n=1 Tax=Cheilinus undulatus TaxID=241271 RepID=UPI001BD4D7E8|nr:leucine-rich repeat neuronal protein 4 [Cheilinus undulatus]
MASCRNLPLFVICLLLIRGSAPLPTMTDENQFKDLPPPDYYDNDEISTTAPPKAVPASPKTLQKCDYNPCLDGQLPCDYLSATTGCLCQGVTLFNVAPLAPDLKSVSWNGSEVVIRWCAPYSYVTAYIVTVGGEHKQEFGKDQRSGGLGDLENVAKVCVVAMNDAGPSKESCMMYQPEDTSLPLKAGLIGGALGFLLLLLLAVLLLRHRRQRKQEAGISMHNTAETTQ